QLDVVAVQTGWAGKEGLAVGAQQLRLGVAQLDAAAGARRRRRQASRAVSSGTGQLLDRDHTDGAVGAGFEADLQAGGGVAPYVDVAFIGVGMGPLPAPAASAVRNRAAPG